MAKKYKLHGEEGYVQNIETMGIIPNDPDNSDRQEYMEWAKINTPDPWKTKVELNVEKYAKEIQDDIEKDETAAIKAKRAASITKLKAEGKLPSDYKDSLEFG